MVHPDVELRLIDDRIGYGVVARKPIPRGTITWVRCELDRRFSPAEFASMDRHYRDVLSRYSFVDAQGDYVLCWDHARFMNHSCAPNCRSAGYDFEIAVRDIAPGEELTDDYGTLNLEYDFDCACRAPQCRRRILPGDLLRFADEWDRVVAEVFPSIAKVPQPLWGLLREKEAVTAALAGKAAIASCRDWYFPAAERGQGRTADAS